MTPQLMMVFSIFILAHTANANPNNVPLSGIGGAQYFAEALERTAIDQIKTCTDQTSAIEGMLRLKIGKLEDKLVLEHADAQKKNAALTSYQAAAPVEADLSSAQNALLGLKSGLTLGATLRVVFEPGKSQSAGIFTEANFTEILETGAGLIYSLDLNNHSLMIESFFSERERLCKLAIVTQYKEAKKSFGLTN